MEKSYGVTTQNPLVIKVSEIEPKQLIFELFVSSGDLFSYQMFIVHPKELAHFLRDVKNKDYSTISYYDGRGQNKVSLTWKENEIRSWGLHLKGQLVKLFTGKLEMVLEDYYPEL